MNFEILRQYILPQHFLSRLAGLVSNCRKTWFKNWLITDFIRRYKVDMSCALEPDPHKYENFNDFFTRALKPSARPIAQEPTAIVSPVDGCISQLGNISTGKILQAKGFNYDVEQLLGGSSQRAAPFSNGKFMTVYLAPKDYHRVHMPLAGQLQEMVYVPGRLFSVNPLTASHVPNLFARNERVVAIFETSAGPMAIILVGAMLVASVSTVWDGMIAPSVNKEIHVKQYRSPVISLDRGAEMGHFQLGSTVIVLFGPKQMTWNENLSPEQSVMLGQMIGKISP